MKRFKHSLSNYHMVTCDMGELIPVNCLEVLPGDTFQQSTNVLVRASPLLAPVFHPVQVRIHHWFVPNRVIWDGWEDFITGEDVTLPPTVSSGTGARGLTDYLGVPLVNVTISSLPIRAYNLIWNEWYRDQDLSSVISQEARDIQKVAWGKDYFTTARPWALKGDPVTLPLGTKAPVVGKAGASTAIHTTDGGEGVMRINITSGDIVDSVVPASTQDLEFGSLADGTGVGLEADLSGATATDINTVRRAFALQRYQEARARYGSRYTEYLRYLGVRSSDARLQRPEFLGGGKATIQFSEVLRTEGSTTVGEFAGHGIAGVRTPRYRKYFEEHGHVLSLMSIRPKSIYMESLARMWSRTAKEDYFQKELETIGQQEVYRREIWSEADDPADPPVAGGNVVFGYADRYREYREEASIVTSDFRTTLDHWHLGRTFASAPTLNDSFVKCVPSKRIHAVQNANVMWCMVNNTIQARRMVNRSAHARII